MGQSRELMQWIMDRIGLMPTETRAKDLERFMAVALEQIDELQLPNVRERLVEAFGVDDLSVQLVEAEIRRRKT